jgi:heat-inducible transcriptional repressor
MKKMKPTISQRQAEILKIIVQEYISNAQPVGSKRILALLDHEVSTATIRKECATLEELGFLEKEHTSSGRVPSSKGYRYYVDYLMAPDQIDKKIFQQLNALFDDRSKSIDLIINESTKMVSELTNLIVVVSQKNLQEDLKVQRIELVPLTSSTAAVVFILSNGEIVKKVYPMDATTMKDLKISIGLFNDNLAGTKLTDLTNNSQKAQQIISQSVKQYDTLFQKLLNSLAEEVGDHSRSYGLKNALINPEFSDTKKVERMLAIIEDISPFD